MEKSIVRTASAAGPFQGAPYSQAVRFGDLLFVAGQVGVAPGSGDLVGDTIEEQTEQVCSNLEAILEAAGSSFANVLKSTVYLADFGDFDGMNDIYGRYVGSEAPPARATVQVAGLPRGARVEIEVIAHL